MYCKRVEVKNFRNIKEAKVEFSEGVNVLVGENAQGKTNLLEAIFLLSVGKSFRAVNSSEMINFGEKSAEISLDYKCDGRKRDDRINIKIFTDKKKTVEKNNLKVEKMSDIVGSFRAVLFCPEHLSLIKDGPAERRQFLDIAISAADPLYLGALQRYNRILKQRNALIKAAEKDRTLFDATVDIWSRQLAREAAAIAKRRKRYIEKAEEFMKKCFFDMTSSKEEPALIYMGVGGKDFCDYEVDDKTEELLYNKLTVNHEREIAAGATLWGIHKDDVEVTLNGRSARSFCSQGQQRSLALALKIAEGELCRLDCGEYPVFLFDDVLSELDRGRRDYLLNHIKGKQVIMTTCEKEGFSADHMILVKNGTYQMAN